MIQAGDWVLMVGTVVEPERGATREQVGDGIYVLPLDEATVERLAEAAFRGYWGDAVSNGVAAWDAPQRREDVREDWRRTVRAVIAELVGDQP